MYYFFSFQIVSVTPTAVLHKTFWKRKTPLMLACENGNLLTVSTLLWASEQVLGPQYTSYVNDAGANGSTPLILACKFGHATVVRVLLEEGASPLPANRRGETAAHVSAIRGNVTCLEILLDSPVRDAGGGAPIAAMAPVRDHAGETRFIDAHDRAGFTALHLAALAQSHASAAALVQRGATLDVPVLRGMERMPYLCGGSTPLHIAAAQGDSQTCTVLLDGQWRHPGLELRRVRNMLGLTPLNCALLGGHHEVVRILVDPGRRSTGGGGGGVSGNISSLIHRNVPLQSSFPESLREHMLAVLQRAALLLQLRQIAGRWNAAGVSQPSDTAVTALPGLDSLSLTQVKRLQRLLRREDASLRDVLYGLETTLHGRGGPGSINEDESGEEEGEAGRRQGGGGEGSSSSSLVPSGSQGLHSETLVRASDWSSRARESQLFGGSLTSHSRLARRERERDRARRRSSAAGGSRTNSATGNGWRGNSSSIGGTSDVEGEVERQYDQVESTIAGISESNPNGRPSQHHGTTTTSTAAATGTAIGTEEGTAIGTENNCTIDGTASVAYDAADHPHDATKGSTTPQGGTKDVHISDQTIEDSDCSICMDSTAEVAFLPCEHSLCFHCACRLCVRGTDATTCPFCRRDVESIFVLAGARNGAANDPKGGPVTTTDGEREIEHSPTSTV